LGHLCVQGLATRAVIRGADLKWIFLGCVLPDLPWILQRVIGVLAPDIASPYDLRLYSIVQGSLVMTLVLGGALALASSAPARVLAILSLNALVHLLLDACQIKWANGVHLFAPFTWEMQRFGLFWPESPLSPVLTVGGLVFFAWAWLQRPGEDLRFSLERPTRLLLGGALLGAYILLPMAMIEGPASADNHSVRTLREHQERPGKPVEFDRNPYRAEHGGSLRTFAGEELQVDGWSGESALLSARGVFVDASRVELREVHVHWPWYRDLGSYVGLLAVACFWIRWVVRDWRARAASRPLR